MNCAPVTVTPSSAKRRRGRMTLGQRADGMDSLPDMFRANSGNGCSTAESGTVLAIPAANVGENVQRIGSEPLTPPVGSCGGQTVAASVDQTGAENIESSQSSSAPPIPVSSNPVSTPAATPPAPQATTPPATQATIPPATPPVSPAAAPAPVSGTTTGACTTPGKSVCSPDGKAWGTCMETLEVIFQPVAQGTTCDPALGVEVPAKKMMRRM